MYVCTCMCVCMCVCMYVCMHVLQCVCLEILDHVPRDLTILYLEIVDSIHNNPVADLRVVRCIRPNYPLV